MNYAIYITQISLARMVEKEDPKFLKFVNLLEVL
jgi:hypothetical protein